MFKHDCLDMCCFGCVFSVVHVYNIFVCTFSAQLSMFHIERHSRNTIIVINIIIIL